MCRICLTVIAVYLIQDVSAAFKEKEVKTKVGRFIGLQREVAFKGVARPYSEFRGIPYAESPTGHLRFKKPVPKAVLKETFNATYQRPPCPQLMFWKDPNFEYDEDCLRLNIYLPENDIKDQKGLPVMIFIHGGAFNFGEPGLFVFDVFSTFGNVIAIPIAYRLSVFGFFSTGDEIAPGNYALWDQHLAIKWVHNNIEAFGGDPNTVTVFGLSAGGASTLFQAIYPGNKGLIQRVIPESGAPANSWAFNKSPDYSKYLSRVGCAMANSVETVECLRAKSVEDLFNGLNEGNTYWYDLGFNVVRDGEFVKVNPDTLMKQMISKPEELKHFASLDLLIGATNMEGGWHMLSKWPYFLGIDDMETFSLTQETFEDIVIPEVLRELYQDDDPKSPLGRAIRYQYTDWSDPNNSTKTRELLLQLSADYPFLADIVETTDVHSKLSQNDNTFFYYVTARPSYGVIFRGIPKWMAGVAHAEDLVFRFGFSQRYVESFGEYFSPTREDLDTAEFMMTVWSNFAKTGNPNEPLQIPIKLPTYTAEGREYVELSHHVTDTSIKKRIGEPWASFWLELVPSLWDVSKEDKNRKKNVHAHTEL